jgi:hypothetical protein
VLPNSKEGTNAYENKYQKSTGHAKIFGAIVKTLLKYIPRGFQKISNDAHP